MKVVSEGKPALWSEQVTCVGGPGVDFGRDRPGCKSVLEIDENDVVCRKTGPNPTNYVFSFKCPVCDEGTQFDDAALPEWVKDKAYKVMQKNRSIDPY